MVKAVFDGARRASPETPRHRRHRRRRRPGLSVKVDEHFEGGTGRGSVRAVLLTVSAPDGTVGRKQELDQDHWRRDEQLGAGLFRLRLEEDPAPRRFRTCVLGRRRFMLARTW
jgi:hypothetical protein